MTMRSRMSLLAVCLVVGGAGPVWAQPVLEVLTPGFPLVENGGDVWAVRVTDPVPSSVQVTVTGSGDELTPQASFSVAQSGDTWLVQYQPPLDRAGTAEFTVVASASTGTTTTTVTRPVDPVTSAPRPPTSLQSSAGAQATLTWAPPAQLPQSDMPSYYVLEIGDAPGLTAFAPMRIPARAPGVALSLPRGGYNFRLRPGNRHGLGPVSADGSVGLAAGIDVPGPPAGVGIALSTNNVATVTWAPPGFGGTPAYYVLEAGTAPGLSNIGRFAVLPTFSLSAGVGPGTYVVRMRAVGPGGEGPASPEVFLTVPGGACAQPSAPVLSTLLRNGRYLMVPWSAPATGKTENYALVAGTTPGAADIVVAPVGSSSSLFMLAPPAGTYHVFVQALSSCGASPASNVVTYVEPAPAAPGAPLGLTATTGPGSVTFAWHPPVTGSRVESYVLEAGPTPGAPTLTIPLTNMPGIGFTGLPSGVTYSVRVRAKNALGTSAPSNEITMTIP